MVNKEDFIKLYDYLSSTNNDMNYLIALVDGITYSWIDAINLMNNDDPRFDKTLFFINNIDYTSEDDLFLYTEKLHDYFTILEPDRIEIINPYGSFTQLDILECIKLRNVVGWYEAKAKKAYINFLVKDLLPRL